jgi:hypothetical protein
MAKLCRAGLLALVLMCLTGALALAQNAGKGPKFTNPYILLRYAAPRPGAALVSPGTAIAVRPIAGDSRALLDGLRFNVTGSRSGHHAGRVILAVDDATLIFEPAQPFTSAEKVQVAIDFGPDVGRVQYQFETAVAHLDAYPDEHGAAQLVEPDLEPPGFASAPSPPSQNAIQTPLYYTAPDDFPALSVTTLEAGVGDGYIFVSPYNLRRYAESKGYLLILDNQGDPVFYKRLYPQLLSIDFKRQPTGHLTYFRHAERGFVVRDNTYTLVDLVQAGNGYQADHHDFVMTEDGRFLLMIYDYQTIDMSAIVPGGHPQALVVGLVIQELDAAHNVIFEWRSWDHISILDTNQNVLAEHIDYVHGNSLAYDTDGHILISSRHLDEVTKINRNTGEITWRLGGKASSFTFTNDPGFRFQHDARRLPDGHLTVYDNRTGLSPRYSRGVEYALDEVAMTATLVREVRNTPDTYGGYLGNMQALSNGNMVVGWGSSSIPVMTEFAPDGRKLFELSMPRPIGSYRAFRFPWRGFPTWPPRLVALARGDEVHLYISWNGATETAAFDVYMGDTPQADTYLTRAIKTGFETVTTVTIPEAGMVYFRAVPVDRDENPGPSSPVVSALVGATAFSHLPIVTFPVP